MNIFPHPHLCQGPHYWKLLRPKCEKNHSSKIITLFIIIKVLISSLDTLVSVKNTFKWNKNIFCSFLGAKITKKAEILPKKVSHAKISVYELFSWKEKSWFYLRWFITIHNIHVTNNLSQKVVLKTNLFNHFRHF